MLNATCRMRKLTLTMASVFSIALAVETVHAQSKRRIRRRRPFKTQNSKTSNSSAAKNTSVSLTIITTDTSTGLRARLWQPTLKKLGVRLRIRSGRKGEKLGVKETRRGEYRLVELTGKLDRRGRLVFEDRTFTRDQSSKLQSWLEELKSFGAQGAPDGKPLWGLTQTQFGQVFKALSGPVKTEIHGKPLGTAQGMLDLPRKYPLRYSFDAKKHLADENPKVKKHVKGHSLGTTLSLILRDVGLGFRPVRTESGSIELVVDPLSLRKDTWPVGWKPKRSLMKTAPALYKDETFELKKVKLLDVFYALSVKTGVPVHVDYYLAKKKKVDPEKKVVSYRKAYMTPSIVLKDLSIRSGLVREVRIDERGQPFVWVTVFVPKVGKRRR